MENVYTNITGVHTKIADRTRMTHSMQFPTSDCRSFRIIF